MALDAFYKLKEKKKKSILAAVSFCLKNKDYDELSVNDISVAADISRGSFYNYFNDKYDAVCTLFDSNVKYYFSKYMTSIEESDYYLIDGTKRIYEDIRVILKNEINAAIMRNLKFFLEFGIQALHSKMFEKDIDEFIRWLIHNTKEGKKALNTHKKMANILDMLIAIVFNTVFNNIMFNSEYFEKYDDFNYKLSIIKKSLKNEM